MHVILEGVLNLETRLLIYSFVHAEKFFTLELLNERFLMDVQRNGTNHHGTLQMLI